MYARMLLGDLGLMDIRFDILFRLNFYFLVVLILGVAQFVCFIFFCLLASVEQPESVRIWGVLEHQASFRATVRCHLLASFANLVFYESR